MTDKVTLTIDGKQVTVPAGTVIVDAARMAGINIPVFCYHPKMEPVGMCRMCLVEVGRPEIDRATREPVLNEDGTPKIRFGPKLETGCTVPVSEGMVVRNLTQKVEEGRRSIVEFILTSHPLDCPICDKGGECPLQNHTMAHGPGNSRFIYEDKIHFSKHVPLGELIYLDRERCIQCARCTRFQSEVVDDPVIGFFNRGRRLEIVTYSDPGFDSYFSGNTTDICPVGALTTADFRFGARPWELSQSASICVQCPVGCNLTFNTRREAKSGGDFVIKRVMPRQNEAVNEIWICDKGRFSTYHFAASPDRVTQPLVRKDGKLTPASWESALTLVTDRFREAGPGLFTLVGGRLSNEDLFNLRQLTAHQNGQAALYTCMAGGDLVAQVGVSRGTNLAGLGPGDAILVVACDLEEEAPLWWLRVKQAAERGVKLIVANPRRTKLDRYATHPIRYRYGEETATLLELAKGDSPAAQAFSGAENALIFFGSESLDLPRSQTLAQACANLLSATGHTGRPNNGLIGVWMRVNTQGAWDMGFRPASDLKAALAKANAVYLAAVDVVGDDSQTADALRSAGFLVVQDLFLTGTAQLADVVLPAQAFTERAGSFTSGERRVQRFYPAIPARPDSWPDFAITAQIGARLGLELEARHPARVMKQIAASVPGYAGVSFPRMAEVEEQWPIMGREDLYYGGTSYRNSQGMGVQLEPGTQRGEPFQLTPVKGDLPFPEKELIAVPITCLYDQGQIIRQSATLQPRLPEPYVVIHPADVADSPFEQGARARLTWAGQSVEVAVRGDAILPRGIVLVPRSLGIPISAPTPVELQVLEQVTV